ncbi:MAG: hypothetical protein GY850_16765 [bacterium]|nr:hypothetical protein [bacterium]
MTLQRIIQWLFLAVTAALLMFLKWLHIGVTHYNIFLLILIGWILMLVIAFRTLSADQRIKD